MVFDLGGGTFDVTVMNYRDNTCDVKTTVGDTHLGGSDFDKVLINMIAERFNALKERQGKPDVRENPKVIKRLLKEVNKLKDILSANKQVVVKLGELADYVTLHTTIERKEFEDAAASYFARVAAPIEQALNKAGLTMEDIE